MIDAYGDIKLYKVNENVPIQCGICRRVIGCLINWSLLKKNMKI